jgi:hypothetical protein
VSRVAAALAVVAGCSSQEAARSLPAGSRRADTIGTAAGRSSQYRLYTHCLASFLSDAGLAIEEQFGDWVRHPLTDTSPEIITIARRG